MKNKLVIFFLVLVSNLSFAGDFIGGDFYLKETESCFYDNPVKCYQKKQKPKKKEKKKEKPIVVIVPLKNNTSAKEKRYYIKIDKWKVPIRKDTPEPIAKALANPTPKNMFEAVKFSYDYLSYLRRWGRLYEATALMYPNLFPRLYPVGLGEANWLNPLRKEAKKKLIQKIQKRIGLIFFYNPACPVCIAFKRFAVALHDRGWVMLGVGYPGIDPSLPFENVVNPYLFQKFGIQQVPTIVAIDKDTKQWRVVSVGLTPVDLIEKRIFDFAYDLGILKEGIYFEIQALNSK
jgi:hypothetical protein